MEYYSAFFFYIYLWIRHAYWQTLWPPFLHRGLSQLGIRDDIFHVPICDAGVNIVVKLCRGPEISSWKQRELPLPLVWFRSRATERPWEDRPKSYVSSFSYTSSQMWELTPAVRDELYRVTPPLWSVLGKLNVVKVYIPDQMPAMSDLMSAGIPPWWRSMLEQFIGAQTSRCSRKQQRLLFIWCTGVSTSPHQLLAYRGLLPLKGFWVCVQAYGITLSSVLTAKHDSTANFLAGIKL